MSPKKATISGLAVLVGVLSSVATVEASCAGGGGSLALAIRSAPVVFVGTVTATSNSDRTATVRVEEIWRGPALAAQVAVHGSSVEGNAVTDVDRHYALGTRYLFVPVSDQQPFDDNNCTLTRPYTAVVAALRPPHPVVLSARPAPGPTGLAIAVAGVGLAALILGAAFILVRRQRHFTLLGRNGPTIR